MKLHVMFFFFIVNHCSQNKFLHSHVYVFIVNNCPKNHHQTFGALLCDDPDRLGRAINLGLAVMLNSDSRASVIMLSSVFSKRFSTTFPNSGILKEKVEKLLCFFSNLALCLS